jgi:FkbM family methyltransferase
MGMVKWIFRKVFGKKNVKSFQARYLHFITSKITGNNERKLLRKRKIFYASFVKKGDFCFDVGANLGNRIEPLLQIGAKVLAIEPQKTCIEYLQHKFGNKITLITKGVSDSEGVKSFYISDSSTISSFSREWINAVKEERFKEYNWDKVVETEMTTLDKLIQEYGVPVFIKIDVEGYELEVLKGLNSPVDVISFEYTTPEQTMKAIDCICHIV